MMRARSCACKRTMCLWEAAGTGTTDERVALSYLVAHATSLITRSKVSPLTEPPPMALLTLRMKLRRLLRRSWAASVRAKAKKAWSVTVQTVSFSGKIRTLVQRIIRIGLEEQVLQANHDGIEIQHRFPVFSEDIQTDISLQVNIWVIDLIRKEGSEHAHDTRRRLAHLWDALDLWWFMGVAGIDSERKFERGAFVHACGAKHVNPWSAPGVQHGDNIPSSGEMVKVKLRRSLGSGKSIVIVEGRSSSVMSEWTSKVSACL